MEEWLTCNDPIEMLDVLQGKATERKTRLFAVACCRRVWHLMPDKRSRKAVVLAERFADQDVAEEDVGACVDAANAATNDALEASVTARNKSLSRAATKAANAAAWSASLYMTQHTSMWLAAKYAARNAAQAAKDASGADYSDQAEEQAQARIVRCIFGNPFRPLALAQEWLSPKVIATAQAIYEKREFDRLPALADSLEASGCDLLILLDHCRQGEEHFRGCWAVDLVRGKH
jgi:hypothetical protein